jgi:uncharacterized protein (DUF58 family)
VEQDTQDILKKVRRIEIKTKNISKHIFSGEYHSAFKGRGMSFSEVRSYQFGDDVRDIDWNVTAKTGATHIKVYEEERELTLMLLVDVSASTQTGSQQIKNDLITEVAALLAFSATTNNDKVGAILFSEQVELYIPPAKGKKHILRIIREMLRIRPASKGTDLAGALRFLTNVQKKKSIAFVLSDYRADTYKQALQIASRRHDIIGIMINDEIDKAMPAVGLLPAIDPESGQVVLVDTTDASSSGLEYLKEAVDCFKRSSADLIQLETGQDYVKVLLRFFKGRHG